MRTRRTKGTARLATQSDLSGIPEIAGRYQDVATASVLENFIDAAEKRN